MGGDGVRASDGGDGIGVRGAEWLEPDAGRRCGGPAEEDQPTRGGWRHGAYRLRVPAPDLDPDRGKRTKEWGEARETWGRVAGEGCLGRLGFGRPQGL